MLPMITPFGKRMTLARASATYMIVTAPGETPSRAAGQVRFPMAMSMSPKPITTPIPLPRATWFPGRRQRRRPLLLMELQQQEREEATAAARICTQKAIDDLREASEVGGDLPRSMISVLPVGRHDGRWLDVVRPVQGRKGGVDNPSQVWLGSHQALLSGTGLAGIIVAAKARAPGRGRCFVPSQKERGVRKKEKEKSIKTPSCRFLALSVAHPMPRKSLPASSHRVIGHLFPLCYLPVHLFVVFKLPPAPFSLVSLQAACETGYPLFCSP